MHLNRPGLHALQRAARDNRPALSSPVLHFKLGGADDLSAATARLYFETVAGSRGDGHAQHGVVGALQAHGDDALGGALENWDLRDCEDEPLALF